MGDRAPLVFKQHCYKTALPSTCISFCSDEGRQIFSEALAADYMRSYFRLAAHFSTQNEPAFCGLSTLATVLNALEVDPHTIWKGRWRWYDESVFDCCINIKDVSKEGITLTQFVNLAECNGLQVTCIRPSAGADPSDDCSEALFREAVRTSQCREDVILVVSYSRAALQQTGDGHFSTIAGYHEARDLVLILDAARFKYLPYWTSLRMLYDAMKPADSVTGLPRGYCLLRRADYANTSQPKLGFAPPPGSLSLAKQGVCAWLQGPAASTNMSADAADMWASMASIFANAFETRSNATAQIAAACSPVSLGGACVSAGPCSCHAAAVGRRSWNVLRRGLELCPIFQLCAGQTEQARLSQHEAGETPATDKGPARCGAATHAMAALRPAHQLTLIILSWPYSNGCYVGGPQARMSCCSPESAARATIMEGHVTDMVAGQGNPMLRLVTDLLRARIVLMLKESTASG